MTAPPLYTVAVRALCEFGAKAGDLDLRFTPSASADEGIAGHERVRQRRGSGWRSELAVEGCCQGLRARGRIDGWNPAQQRLEEVKTHRGALDRMPANHRALHWAQAQVYGALLCEQLGLAALEIALVYFDVDSEVETPIARRFTASELRAFFEAQCARFVAFAQRQQAHRAARDAALAQLAWPFAQFPAGQRQLATAVYNAARSGRCLLAQAPTGSGKTMGTLFSMLKAMPGQSLDALFFVTAKTPGRALALDAARRLLQHDDALPLRVLELTARDVACEHPDKACHGDSCPLARGFYDRLPAARDAALALPVADRSALRALAAEHAVCPYYLAQELARWVDVVVGDYNHYFDHGALLHGLAQQRGWRVSVLVDEAHNLVERARLMFSAELDPRRFAPVRALLKPARRRMHGGADEAGDAPTPRPTTVAPVANGVDGRTVDAFALQAPPGDDAPGDAPRPSTMPAVPAALARASERLARAWRVLAQAQTRPYAVLDAPPEPWRRALQEFSAELGAWLADAPHGVPHELLEFHFDALRFARLLDGLGAHSQLDVQLRTPAAHAKHRTPQALLCVRNVVPAPLLRDRFDTAHSTVLFSATLAPPAFHLDLLGLPESTGVIDIDSPFSRAQLQVHIARAISTRPAARAASLQPIARRIAAQYDAAPGNYLAFFSSFEYLQQAAAALAALRPDIAQWQQSRGMPEAERAAFVERFAPDGRGIGFAVLGGAFGEGIDLPGSRLVGAFIATLGLPQLNEVNEAMKARMAQIFGDGWRYTYLYPGLQKVVQAAGRVIRGPGDRGVVHLIDERYARAEVRALLPRWWGVAAGEAASFPRGNDGEARVDEAGRGAAPS